MARVLNDAEVEASRIKGVKDAQKLIGQIPANIPDKERFQRLSDAFVLCAERCWRPMIDNFDEGEFYARGNDKKGDDVTIILLGCFQAAAKLETLGKAMGGMDRNAMNGQAVILSEHEKLSSTLEGKLNAALSLYVHAHSNTALENTERIYAHGSC